MTDASPSVAAALAARLGAQLVETHISWVLLAGDDAYKIKKPVRLSFVDYSSLAARRHFCEEELRLNRRLAPSLYLDVAAITGSAGHPQLGGSGAAIEYAVHMRRFPQGCLFSEMLDRGALGPQPVDALAGRLAAFHAAVSRDVPDPAFGSARRRLDSAQAALEGVRAQASWRTWRALRAWLDREAHRLLPLWIERRAEHRVRECHGDLHLANLIALDGDVMAFDGIEFDPALRWIDVLDDIAFTVMDLDASGARGLAFRFLDAWLDATGDHGAVPALRFAVVYRALVRAQVAGLRGDPPAVRRYLRAALRWTRAGAPQLAITHGLPGSGKTFQSQRFLEAEGAIRLRSDVERKRLFGLAALEDSRDRGIDLYTPEAGERTYAHLLRTARVLLEAGYPVVLDAAYLRRVERDAAHALARDLRVPFTIIDCDAPVGVLRARLRERRGDASEADEAVLEKLRATAEPLASSERRHVLRP
jgi:aminoglycoside phosphotransferase family enzyme/predicted kinase